jgi:hypothetical protein
MPPYDEYGTHPAGLIIIETCEETMNILGRSREVQAWR